MSKIQRQFSIEEYEKGAEVETRGGRKVRILCTDADYYEGSIIGLTLEDTGEMLMAWHADGHYLQDQDDRDLVIVEEIESPEEHEQYNGDVCGDNRFEIIDAAKKHLLDATNINTSPKEMEVIDSFLFRCWQMGWLKDFETKAQNINEEAKPWSSQVDAIRDGWRITEKAIIEPVTVYINDPCNYQVFATKKLAESALAMARLSQLIVNDSRYGGPITDEEWEEIGWKYIIYRGDENNLETDYVDCGHYLLAFHTPEQRDLFLTENKELIKDYLMIN